MIIHKFKVKKKKEISFKTLINPLTYYVSFYGAFLQSVPCLYSVPFRTGRHMTQFTGLFLIVVQQHSRHPLVASLGAATTVATAIAVVAGANDASLSLS